MKSTIVEVTNGPNNWGKFLLCQYEEKEITYRSRVGGINLFHCIGENHNIVWVLDLQTGEGARFLPKGHGMASIDLEKHRIWVCPLFEPFLNWLYANPQHHADVRTAPSLVDLPDAPFAISGYRREGPK